MELSGFAFWVLWLPISGVGVMQCFAFWVS